MSETSRGPGWWQASDGKWYPPEQHPEATQSTYPATAAEPARGPWRRFRRWPTWVQVLSWVLVAIVLLAVIRSVGSGDPGEQEEASTTTARAAATAPGATATTQPASTTASPTTTSTTTSSTTTTAAPPTAPPQPATQTFEGQGQTATASFPIEGGLTVFRTRHQGTSNFQVLLLDSNGEPSEFLVNEIGSHDGATGVGVRNGRYILEIEADGPWSVVVEQPRAAVGAELPQAYQGTGQSFVGPFQGGGALRVEMTHQGESNFQVLMLDSEGNTEEFLANEIGSFQGSDVVSSRAELYFFTIEADGAWTVHVSKA